jgi:hypothetical protein
LRSAVVVNGSTRLVSTHVRRVHRDEGLVARDSRGGSFDDTLVERDFASATATRTERHGDEERLSGSSATVYRELPDDSDEPFPVSADERRPLPAADPVSFDEAVVERYESEESGDASDVPPRG